VNAIEDDLAYNRRSEARGRGEAAIALGAGTWGGAVSLRYSYRRLKCQCRRRGGSVASAAGANSVRRNVESTTRRRDRGVGMLLDAKAIQFKDPPAKAAPLRNEKGVISQSFWYL
jgi:hypothetical protein